MALAAYRASHWCTSRNSQRLPEDGRDRGATTGCLGTASAGKTGQRVTTDSDPSKSKAANEVTTEPGKTEDRHKKRKNGQITNPE
jgi:hypothetical protein